MKPKIENNNIGLLIAVIILCLWLTSLILLLQTQVNFYSPLTYIFILVQMHLYTGVFITAHDAIHGTVAANSKINQAVGFLCAFLFAYNWYPLLSKKHHIHHKSPVTKDDPDYHDGSFLQWYMKFLTEYVTWWQIVLMAVTYNILNLCLNEENIVLFWMTPAILSTLQLFLFGTYLPHKGMHKVNDRYKAKSQAKNHFLAFITCYFFGYHYEHHKYPYVPWWKLPEYR